MKLDSVADFPADNRLSAAETSTVGDLNLGDEAVVHAVSGDNALLRNKLLTMGIVSNTPLRVTNIAPLGDPIGISVRGFKLCLRRSEARSIHIRKRTA